MIPVLSVAQVCEWMGCKERQVFYLLAEGVLERAPRYGKEIRIYRDSVERALARPKRRKARISTPAGWDPSEIPL